MKRGGRRTGIEEVDGEKKEEMSFCVLLARAGDLGPFLEEEDGLSDAISDPQTCVFGLVVTAFVLRVLGTACFNITAAEGLLEVVGAREVRRACSGRRPRRGCNGRHGSGSSKIGRDRFLESIRYRSPLATFDVTVRGATYLAVWRTILEIYYREILPEKSDRVDCQSQYPGRT
jgi:hypothetical protein